MQPILPGDFGLAEHRFSVFSCIIAASITVDTITSPELFVNVATKLSEGDEIRAVADDQSFVAKLFVTFVRGTDVRVKVLEFYEFEENEDIDEPDDRYKISVRGAKRVCVQDMQTGEFILENLPDKKTAHRELDDYIRAMNR